jgi:hypothetical protein
VRTGRYLSRNQPWPCRYSWSLIRPLRFAIAKPANSATGMMQMYMNKRSIALSLVVQNDSESQSMSGMASRVDFATRVPTLPLNVQMFVQSRTLRQDLVRATMLSVRTALMVFIVWRRLLAPSAIVRWLYATTNSTRMATANAQCVAANLYMMSSSGSSDATLHSGELAMPKSKLNSSETIRPALRRNAGHCRSSSMRTAARRWTLVSEANFTHHRSNWKND